MKHWHITPKGNPHDALGWQYEETARKTGRKLYGAKNYRLHECHLSGCAVYPPTPTPLVSSEAAR